MYRVAGDPAVCTQYVDGVQQVYPTEDRWRFMCGSKTGGMTVEDLKRIAENHAAQMAAVDGSVVTVDTPRLADRGPGGVNVIFNINTSGMPSGAMTAFTLAEQFIESQWTDPITITVSVSWTNLGSGVIGATSSNYVNNISWTNSRAGLVNGKDGDDTIQDFLPTGSTIPVRFNATSAAITDLGSLNWTRANYRATVGSVSGTDATMQYNTQFFFDFDPSNGISSGALSLVDTIIHEVGHAMGFVSEADDPFATRINPMDLFRFARSARSGVSNTNPSTTAQFMTYAREVDYDNPGTDDANSDFVTAAFQMSDGDPYQASHFFQQSAAPAFAIGIMQPALSDNVSFYPNYFRTADLTVFDAIGWDRTSCSGAPSISVHPSAQAVCQGGTLSLSITASGATSYQWRRNSVDIPGADSSTFVLNGFTGANTGTYTCVATNGCGSSTSNGASVALNTLPSISVHPSDASGCEGVSRSFSVVASGTPTPTYQWRLNFAPISGATSATLNIPSIGPSDDGTYDCVITNTCGSVASDPATLTVGLAPGISIQPTSQAVCEGSALSVGVLASGVGPFTYQWRRNGVDVSGGIGPNYSFNPINPSDAGNYDCIVTNACGSTTTNIAVITVNTYAQPAVPPVSQNICDGDPVTFTVGAIGTGPIAYQWKRNGTNISGANGSSYTIAAVSPGDAGNYTCEVSNLCGPWESDPPAVLTVLSAPSITQQPAAAATCEGHGFSLTVAASGSGTLSYQWRKDSANIGGANAATYMVASAVPGDAGSYDCVVTDSCDSVTSAAASVSVDPAPMITQQPAAAGGCAGDDVQFVVAANGATTYQWQRNGTDLSDGPTGSGSVISGATASTLGITGVAAADVGTYRCRVGSSCGDAFSDDAALTIDEPIQITQQPLGDSKCLSGSVTFTIAATGTGPITYQWRQGGTDLAGEVSDTLVVSPVTTASAGSYDCIVGNACGSVASDAAALALCVGDFNCSDAISVQDIFDFLAAYFGNSLSADVNGSGVISVQDIFDFLAAYFAGCP